MDGVAAMPETVVVLGGASDLAAAVLRRLAKQRLSKVLLAGRHQSALEAVGRELTALGVDDVETATFDACDVGAHEAFADEVARRVGPIDLVIVAAGRLSFDGPDDLTAGVTAETISTNFTGLAAAMVAFAWVLRRQGRGCIVVFSSAAAVRVRRGELRLRRRQSGPRCFRSGARRRSRRERCRGDRRASRVRPHEDDDGTPPAAPRDDGRRRRGRRGSGARFGRRRRLGSPGAPGADAARPSRAAADLATLPRLGLAAPRGPGAVRSLAAPGVGGDEGPGAGRAFTAARLRAFARRSAARRPGDNRSQTQSQWRETTSPARRSPRMPTPSTARRTRSVRAAPSTSRSSRNSSVRFRTTTVSPSTVTTRPHRMRHRSRTASAGPSVPDRSRPSQG